MDEEEKPNEPDSNSKPSEEYVKFEAAMRRIVSVSKEDIVHRLPKMFQERVADARKKRKKAFRTAARPPE